MSEKEKNNIVIDKTGDYRIIERSGKIYVVGHGICWPMETMVSAETIVRRLKDGL